MITAPLDVTRKTEVFDAVAAVEKNFGPIDVLVNNAGVMPVRPMCEVNTTEWDTMIDVNLKGVLYGVAAVLPAFLRRGRGHIINVSSVAGFKVFSPGGTVYSATKFATSVEPGMVESELKHGTTSDAAAFVLDAYKIAIPASSVARAIAYAIEQPDEVDVNEIVLRPVRQEH